jgi:hypothetical protein
MKLDRFDEQTDQLAADAADDQRRLARLARLGQRRVGMIALGVLLLALYAAPYLMGGGGKFDPIALVPLFIALLAYQRLESEMQLLRVVGGLKKVLQPPAPVGDGQATGA